MWKLFKGHIDMVTSRKDNVFDGYVIKELIHAHALEIRHVVLLTNDVEFDQILRLQLTFVIVPGPVSKELVRSIGFVRECLVVQPMHEELEDLRVLALQGNSLAVCFFEVASERGAKEG